MGSRLQYKQISSLLRVNRILLNRGSRIGRMTPVPIVILCILFVVVPFSFYRTIEASALADQIPLLGNFIYLLVFIEIIFAAGRSSIGSTLHQGHLLMFPLSSGSRMAFHFLDQALSLKSVVYLGFSLTTAIYIASIAPVAGAIAVLLFLVFFIVMSAWVALFTLLMGRTFQSNKALYPMLAILYLLPVYLSLFNSMDPLVFIRFVTSGVFGFVGNGIRYSMEERWLELSMLSGKMLLLAGAAIVAGIFLLKKKEPAAYF